MTLRKRFEYNIGAFHAIRSEDNRQLARNFPRIYAYPTVLRTIWFILKNQSEIVRIGRWVDDACEKYTQELEAQQKRTQALLEAEPKHSPDSPWAQQPDDPGMDNVIDMAKFRVPPHMGDGNLGRGHRDV